MAHLALDLITRFHARVVTDPLKVGVGFGLGWALVTGVLFSVDWGDPIRGFLFGALVGLVVGAAAYVGAAVFAPRLREQVVSPDQTEQATEISVAATLDGSGSG